MIGLRAMAAPLFVPADAVTLRQRDCGGRTPGSRGVRPRTHALLRPGGADSVDPRPLRLDLVAADEQGWIAFDEVEQQPLVGDPASVLAERIGEADVERNFAQPDALPVETRSLGHQPQLDAFLGLEADDQLVRL